jgi:ATP-dependent Clp endopeptidase proteolytic subunit ClpP
MITDEKEYKEEESSEEEDSDSVFHSTDEEEPPLVGLVGDIHEESMQQVVLALLTFNGGRVLQTDPDVFEDADDIQFFISSSGGSVNDMFAIHDLMELIKQNRDIATFGYGKIASAAVPILAAGTKGKRYMAKHARMMLHHCSSNFGGPQPTVRSNFAELKKVEDMMVEVLVEHSSLSAGEIYNILSKNIDEYFSAEEALEMGLVDKII